jgi:GrpB-like predicted nucleotidyltransferase (UPF0157 family)
MTNDAGSPIGPYTLKPVACLPYDPRALIVARDVTALIVGRRPAVRVEHIGSTAVPGCAGKGIVDLVVLYAEGDLEATRDALDALGFQRQTYGMPFPESRPMRVGTYIYDGMTYHLHVHVVQAGTDEATSLLAFREALRADARMAARYVKAKREIVARGVADGRQYTEHKAAFIVSEIERLRSGR